MNYKHDIYRTKFRKEEILEPGLGDDWLILDLGLLRCHCGARRIEKGILISKDIYSQPFTIFQTRKEPEGHKNLPDSDALSDKFSSPYSSLISTRPSCYTYQFTIINVGRNTSDESCTAAFNS